MMTQAQSFLYEADFGSIYMDTSRNGIVYLLYILAIWNDVNNTAHSYSLSLEI